MQQKYSCEILYLSFEGRQFDKHGNLKQWWNNRTIAEFRKAAQCIIDQYSNYTLEQIGLPIDGRLTQGENIADNGGLKQAFRVSSIQYTRHFLTSPGQTKGASDGKGTKGAGKGKGQGKGTKGKTVCKSSTPPPDSRQICYAFNDPNRHCDGNCGRAHVCGMCFKENTPMHSCNHGR